jgi:hypothetical protein
MYVSVRLFSLSLWPAGSLLNARVASEAVEIIVTAKIAENSKTESNTDLSIFNFMVFSTSIHFWSKNCLSSIENKRCMKQQSEFEITVRAVIAPQTVSSYGSVSISHRSNFDFVGALDQHDLVQTAQVHFFRSKQVVLTGLSCET